MHKDTDLDIPMPDIVITEPIASLRAKIRLAAELDKLPAGAPSPNDPLTERPQTEGASEPWEEVW